MKQLILGGARSGKSKIAEKLANESGKQVIYIATGEVKDDEMQKRIHHHQKQRPSSWQTVEEPIMLANVLKKHDVNNVCLLVDCLTLWVTNCLLNANAMCWVEQRNALLDVLSSLQADIIFVSNEVGQGIVPLGEINRQFVDETGFLHQTLAQQCERVSFIVAGLPQLLKS